MFAARIRSHCRKLARQQGGAAAVEFAIVGGFFITALVGILELGMIYLVSATMEGGIRDATRFGTTGQGATPAARAQHIIDVMNTDTMNMLHLTTANVTTKVYKSFGAIGVPETYTDKNRNGRYDSGEPYTDANGNGRFDLDQGIAGTGNAEDIVLYTVSYDWPLMFGTLLPYFGENGKITLSASQAIQNEPYAPI